MSVEVVIGAGEDGRALGEVLRARGFSRRLILRLKRTEGGMTRGGELIRTVDRVCVGERILLCEGEGKRSVCANPELRVSVLYEDEGAVVFDKPAMMPVHPSIRHTDDTLGNCFAAMYPTLTFRPVSRLDRDTTGCVIAAKSQYAAAFLQCGFEKRYMAVCCGELKGSGVIDAPIARQEDSIITRCVREDGKPSVTEYRVIASNGRYSLCEVVPVTGRTHQIRVHFAHIGHPLAGDGLYGGSREDIDRQALHCREVSFISPADGKRHTVSSDMPEDMKRLTER